MPKGVKDPNKPKPVYAANEDGYWSIRIVVHDSAVTAGADIPKAVRALKDALKLQAKETVNARGHLVFKVDTAESAKRTPSGRGAITRDERQNVMKMVRLAMRNGDVAKQAAALAAITEDPNATAEAKAKAASDLMALLTSVTETAA